LPIVSKDNEKPIKTRMKNFMGVVGGPENVVFEEMDGCGIMFGNWFVIVMSIIIIVPTQSDLGRVFSPTHSLYINAPQFLSSSSSFSPESYYSTNSKALKLTRESYHAKLDRSFVMEVACGPKIR
jgi:hypothetical protein